MNKELYFSGITLGDMHAIINRMQAPENLCIKKIAFGYFEGDIIGTTLDFLSKSELEIFTVSSSTIHLDDAIAIANLIKGSKLLTLELLRCTLDADTLLTIMSSIKGSFLQKIMLDRCAIGMNEARAIAGAMALPRTRVIKLYFRDCIFHEDALLLILNAVKESTLQKLALEYIKLNDTETIAIADYIADANDTLTKLSLVGTTNNAQLAITTAIHNCSIRTVDVRQTSFFNNVGDVLKLIEYSRIEKFDFGKSCFNAEEIVMIMDVIKRNPSFKHISFADVPMSDYMFGKTCDLLENSSLISLHGCNLDSAQLCELLVLIKQSSITSLGLRIREHDMLGILDLIKAPNLIKLDLYLMGITNEIIRSMLPSIKDSSLIKFGGNFWKIEPDTKAELDQILFEQRKRLGRFRHTKSAMLRE